MNAMKNKLLAGALALASAVPVFAEETSGSTPAMDTEAAETMMESIQTGFSSLLEAAQPIITTIILAALGIWVGFFIVRLAKRALKTGS